MQFLWFDHLSQRIRIHRDAVKKSNTVGLPIYGEQRTQTFPDSFIEESLILSDLFDLNEYAALELLIAGTGRIN